MGRGVLLIKQKREETAAPYYLIPANPKYPFTTKYTWVNKREGTDSYSINMTSGGVYYTYNNSNYPKVTSVSTTTINLHGHKTATLKISGGNMSCTNSGYQKLSVNLKIGTKSVSWSITHTAGWEQPEDWNIPSATRTLDISDISGQQTCTLTTSAESLHAGHGRYTIAYILIE